MIKPSDIIWSKNLFNALDDAGTWGVSRCGLVFTKRGSTMVLTHRAPWSAELGQTAAIWRRYQNDEFDMIRDVFKAAGINVLNHVQ